MSKPVSDDDVMRALALQVAKAARGNTEVDVTTIITKPMWKAFLRAVGEPENSKPTPWLGLNKTIRVWGSKTIVVKSKRMASVSFIPCRMAR